MSQRGAIEFDPVVEFPDNSFDAARVYLGVLAYPEAGAGLPDGLGVRFSAALWQYVVWQRRKARGLRDVRDLFGDPNFMPPRLRDFEKTVERGRRRLRRRIAAFDIVGNQMVNAIVNGLIEANRLTVAGKPDDAFEMADPAKLAPIRGEMLSKALPSARRIMGRDLPRWSKRLDLNHTGSPADSQQKEKDLVSRGFLQSRPVLHLAHGLNQTVADSEELFEGLEEADWLLVLLWRAERWVWQAIKHAIDWRFVSRWTPIPDLSPAHMIELVLPKNVRDNAPCKS